MPKTVDGIGDDNRQADETGLNIGAEASDGASGIEKSDLLQKTFSALLELRLASSQRTTPWSIFF
ncbi:MAG TPA: hypothetical protein VL992_06705 [Tepidisphaeraceae bacterium]|nr:hypothetical protein [Tepidisphaeraceae bacterium]